MYVRFFAFIFSLFFNFNITCSYAKVVGCPLLPLTIISGNTYTGNWIASYKEGGSLISLNKKDNAQYEVAAWFSGFSTYYERRKYSVISCCHDIDGEVMICLSKKMEGMDCRNKFVKIGEFHFECDKIK